MMMSPPSAKKPLPEIHVRVVHSSAVGTYSTLYGLPPLLSGGKYVGLTSPMSSEATRMCLKPRTPSSLLYCQL